MKNTIFKVVGAVMFFSAITKANNAFDMAMNGSESRAAKSFDRMVEDAKERRRKRSKPDEGSSEEAEV